MKKVLYILLFFLCHSVGILRGQSGCDHDERDQFVICAPLALKGEATIALSIFPNPTSDYFEIRADSPFGGWGDGYIFDIAGRLVKRFDPLSICDVSGFSNGLYIIHVNNQIFKIVKQ